MGLARQTVWRYDDCSFYILITERNWITPASRPWGTCFIPQWTQLFVWGPVSWHTRQNTETWGHLIREGLDTRSCCRFSCSFARHFCPFSPTAWFYVDIPGGCGLGTSGPGMSPQASGWSWSVVVCRAMQVLLIALVAPLVFSETKSEATLS